ncbi:tyrosine protein phosphatase [Paenibacillus antri]|uniref:Tyrosine-protein phosphatase n=1 Tax=Paenibacillus antri TaxID=2582848 RepID=A0A5R9G6I0_9BACL|nr:CpsB/CapC family capsule biosynthesis tyrosine phosphatase [Paenibacillus antri]TLS52002.1 tyrosine protein phosphatase [Paenibacillus antri]
MIDIHSHILPGADDGSPSLEGSLEMARAAVSDGIQIIAATPHHKDGYFVNEKIAILKAVEQLNDALRQADIPLMVVPGQEVRHYESLIEDLYDGSRLLTINNSKYLLLEFPSGDVPSNIQDTLHELGILGITPIIAHPERNRAIASKPDLMEELIEWGALAQVTSQSLVGRFGPKVQRTAEELCRRNLVHLIATDAHNITTRPFLMREAMEWVMREQGDTYRQYYETNAKHVLSDLPIRRMGTVRTKKKSLFFWRK